MLVVIALVAILATIVAVSLAGSYGAARMDDVAGKIEAFDRLAREHSRNTGRAGGLVFDLGSGSTIRSISSGERDENRSNGSPVLYLPADSASHDWSLPAGTANGPVTVACSPLGQTPSYAILLNGPRSEQRWIVVAGLTGKTNVARDEQEVQDIFRASPAIRATSPPNRETRRPAMTLVEVVGGLALLATLLVAALLAQGRYMRQAASADRRLQAVTAADALLTSWRLDPRSLPHSGVLASSPAMRGFPGGRRSSPTLR